MKKILSPPPLVVRPSQLEATVGFGRVTAWRLENQGLFPKRRKITPGGSVGWLYSEIEEYLNNCEQIA